MPKPTPRTILLLVLALLVLAGAAIVFRPWSWFGSGGTEKATIPSLIESTEGDLVYLLHAPTETEELYDVAADPHRLRNLARQRPEDTARLRQATFTKYGLSGFEDLRKHFQDIQDQMRGLGYK